MNQIKGLDIFDYYLGYFLTPHHKPSFSYNNGYQEYSLFSFTITQIW